MTIVLFVLLGFFVFLVVFSLFLIRYLVKETTYCNEIIDHLTKNLDEAMAENKILYEKSMSAIAYLRNLPGAMNIKAVRELDKAVDPYRDFVAQEIINELDNKK